MLQTYIKTPFRLIVHPFQEFWDLKYENTGRLRLALIFVFLLAVVNVLGQEVSGFLVNYTDPRTINSISQLEFIVLPYILWCVANWSLTTLMDGEGKFVEILMATAYALLPMIVIDFVMIWLSRILTIEEDPIYFLFKSLATIWFIWLLFIGTMTVHQYSIKKTIVTMLLTLVVILFILFIGLLFFSLIQEMLVFIETIYKELRFRTW